MLLLPLARTAARGPPRLRLGPPLGGLPSARHVGGFHIGFGIAALVYVGRAWYDRNGCSPVWPVHGGQGRAGTDLRPRDPGPCTEQYNDLVFCRPVGGSVDAAIPSLFVMLPQGPDLPELGSSEQGDKEVYSDPIRGARKRPLCTVQEHEDLGMARRTDSTVAHQKKSRLGPRPPTPAVSTCSSRGSGRSTTRHLFEPTARARSEGS